MSIVLTFAIVAAVLVVPVMIGARMVGARNRTFGPALLAVILMSIASVAIDENISNDIVAFAAMLVVGAIVLSTVLGTTFLRGVAISMIATVIQLVAILVIAGSVSVSVSAVT